jgi:hypothetical protein
LGVLGYLLDDKISAWTIFYDEGYVDSIVAPVDSHRMQSIQLAVAQGSMD